MRQHADDPLPRLLLFFAQRAGEVREDEELVWLAVASEGRSTELESTALGPERTIEQPRGFALETLIEPELPCVFSEQRGGRLADQTFGGRIDQHELLVHVEREDTDVDRAHDARQQRRGLHGLGALALQRIAQRVDLVHHQIDRAARSAAGATDRVIAFAQRAEQVRLKIEGACDHLKGHRGCPHPDHEDHRGDRPANFEGVVLTPGQIQERDRRG